MFESSCAILTDAGTIDVDFVRLVIGNSALINHASRILKPTHAARKTHQTCKASSSSRVFPS